MLRTRAICCGRFHVARLKLLKLISP
jgi:hypothetical protein